ncbi:MAG: HAMP domain-containing protein [Planctomycetes bacterium]|nr:HAMP domain-containing protein [Planctomycetota bacterium]
MHWPRGLAVKLAIVFLILGLVPMATVGIIASYVAERTMAEAYIENFVERVARDAAINLDTMLRSSRRNIDLLGASSSMRQNVIALYAYQREERGYAQAIADIQSDLNDTVEILGTVDLLAVVDLDGRILVTSNLARSPVSTGRLGGLPAGPRPLWSDESSNPLEGRRDLVERAWWREARESTSSDIDWGLEALVLEQYGYPPFGDDATDQPDALRERNAEAYAFGFTRAIHQPDDVAGTLGPQAILVAFFNWTAVQAFLDNINSEFQNQHEQYRSGYTFLFGRDFDTVIAHRYRQLYGTSLIRDHGQEGLRQAIEQSPRRSGHHYYTYRVGKVAGFAPVATTGWEIGFGINESDYLEATRRMRDLMLVIGLIVAGLIVLFIAVTSRRITRPITNLIKQSNEIARGNLDARVETSSRDEIGLLGDSFNKMAEDLKASNKRLVQAEKTAAWREMARQVAHEIKNPLTPIKLSAQLVERAWDDRHPDFEAILKESVRNIVGQSESLRKIASEFSNFAAFPKRDPRPCRIVALARDCVRSYENRASSGVEIRFESFLDEDIEILVDEDEIRRVFYNVFNNAFEAMPEGGLLSVSLFRLEKDEGPTLDIRIKDTGRGIAAEMTERLFEPYFTTRSSGTGLGLAICKKTIEGYGGTVAIRSEEGKGTTVCIELPLDRLRPKPTADGDAAEPVS